MRKCSLPRELAILTAEHLAQLDHWLDRFTYEKTQQLFLETHRVPIGRMKLCRYNQRRLKAQSLTPITPAPLTAADLVAIKNGTPIPDERLNKELLLYRTFQLASGPIKSAFELRELHQIATYEQRHSLVESRLEIEQRNAALRIRRAELRERNLAFRQQHARSNLSTQKELVNRQSFRKTQSPTNE